MYCSFENEIMLMLYFIHDGDEFINKENNIHMVSTTSSIQYANNSK